MHNMNYGLGYLERLKLAREELQRQQDAIPKPLPLEQRIKLWYNELSEDEKHREYTMLELKCLLKDTPQKIGAALFGMGWTRRRSWVDAQPTSRYWFKKQ